MVNGEILLAAKNWAERARSALSLTAALSQKRASIASALTCRRHVRLAANLGSAEWPGLPVEGIGLDVIQTAKPEPPIMRYELTDFE